MSVKEEWLKPRLRVLTPNGPGIIKYSRVNGVCRVKLDDPVAGEEISVFQRGEVVVESDFTLVRLVNLGFLDYYLISSAQNYPTWEECLEALKQPFSQDEILIALNFEKKEFRTNRLLPQTEKYNFIQCYFDVHKHMEAKFYDFIEEAKKAWEEVDRLDGITNYILLCCIIDLETSQILSRALFSRMKVIAKETYW